MTDPEDTEPDFFASESAQAGPRGPSDGGENRDDEDEGDETDDPNQIDWINGEDVIVQEQQALAVYLNTGGGIVIRAERGMYEREDAVIVLAAPGAAYRLIEAIQKQLEILKEQRKR